MSCGGIRSAQLLCSGLLRGLHFLLHLLLGLLCLLGGVDLSTTYLDWAAQNFRANSLTKECHELLQADCREWLTQARAASWDLIFLDPPTFSNSKRMEGVLDTQRDHLALIEQCMRLLAPGGLLVFSTNAQRFKLDDSVGQRWAVEDISAATIPFDFKGNPRIHRAFELRVRY